MQVVAAISIRGGLVLCCRRLFGISHGGLWEFPGGKIEPNESDHGALIREIAEELSQQITVNELFLVSNFVSGDTNIELRAYFVTGISKSVLPGNSHIEVKWLPVSELDTLSWAPADIPIVNRLTTELSTRGKNNVV